MATLADYPHLVAQIDRRNGPIAPKTIAPKTARKLWWRCPEGPDHLWEVAVKNRTDGSGCPFCAGRAVSVTNALPKVAPAVARQWHPTKNGTLRPRDVAAGTQRHVWWKCPKGVDHVWSAPVDERVRGRGCPFCSGNRATLVRNLAVVHPELACEWHPTKNGDLRPLDLTPRSCRQVFWLCAEGHEWSARPADRACGYGCPYCSGHRVTPERTLAALAPEIARQWHPTKNGDLSARNVTRAAGRNVWWKCPEGPDHEWQASVARRWHGGIGCPFCTGHRVSVTNSLATRFPLIASEWHPTKNGKLTPNCVTFGSQRRVFWRCTEGHEWQAIVTSRTRPPPAAHGCPFCANQRVSSTNSLAARFPKLAREWHPTKNGDLTPHNVIAGSQRRAWWRCAFGHEWQTAVYARSRGGTGCPECWRLRRRAPVATTGRKRGRVRFAEYEGAHHGPVRRVK